MTDSGIPKPVSKTAKYKLSICRCPAHPNFLSVSLDDFYAGTGVRLTASKCCGRWEVIKSWPMDEREMGETAHLFLNAAEESRDFDYLEDKNR